MRAPLGTFVTIVKSNMGLLLLYWNQFAQVHTQQSSILSNVQMRVHGNIVSDVNKQLGGQQMILTPNGYMIPIVYKAGLPYIQHAYPTNEQMESVTQHEIMTSPAPCDPSKFDNHSPDAVEQQITQFSSTPQDAIDEF